jgi:hypothetical protein
MERRDRNQVKTDARRTETTGGMISDLMLRGEPIRDPPSLKGDQGRSQCQGFQLIRVFGTLRYNTTLASQHTLPYH